MLSAGKRLRSQTEYVSEYVARLVSQSHIQVYSMTYSGESRDMH